MNNEPVAWTACLDCGKRVTGDSIHTCSPQLKTLTEWEIKECWEEATEMQEHFCSQYFDFAQLILRKAQEK